MNRNPLIDFIPFIILLHIISSVQASGLCDSTSVTFVEFASERVRACGGERSCLQIEINSGMEQGWQDADCNCLENYLTLGLQLRLLDSSHLKRFESICQVKSGSLHFSIGTRHLEVGRPMEAIQAFEKALASGVDSAGCFSNMGIAAMQAGNLNEAMQFFGRALERTSSEEINFLGLLVTISSLHLQMGDPSRALEWADRFEFEFSKVEDKYAIIPALKNQAQELADGNQLNRLMGHMDLNDSAYVQEHWNAIPWGNMNLTPIGRLQNMFRVADFLQSPQLILAFRDDLERSLEMISQEQAEEALGAFALLHPTFRNQFFGDLPVYTAWNAISSAKALMSSPKAENLSEAEREKTQPTFLAQNAAGIAAIAGFVLFLASTFARLKSRRRLNDSAENHFGYLFSQLKSGSLYSSEWAKRLAQVHDLYQTRIQDWLLRSKIKLSAAELQMLFGLCTGHSPKEMAKWSNSSVGHAYNICSNLRTKLNVPDDWQIKEWVDSELKTKSK